MDRGQWREDGEKEDGGETREDGAGEDGGEMVDVREDNGREDSRRTMRENSSSKERLWKTVNRARWEG